MRETKKYRSARISRRLSPAIFISLLMATLAAWPAGSKSAAPQSAPDRSSARAGQKALPGYDPASWAGTDEATGLPKRIVHKASGIVLVLIPAGEFLMGSASDDPDRSKKERQHRRRIGKTFYLSETEVTVGQFREFVQATGFKTDAERGTLEGRYGKGAFASIPEGNREWSAKASWQNPFPYLSDYCANDDDPVVQVSWNDAQSFCAHFGLGLPSEAQWEYAARAGSRTRFPWGDWAEGGKGHANVNDATHRRRFPSTSVGFTFDDGAALISSVGRYKANAWMLRDMIGNVAEWCQDAYQNYPADGADETAAFGDSKASRVVRGGSWLDDSYLCRSAARPAIGPEWRRDFVGFRVAMNPSL